MFLSTHYYSMKVPESTDTHCIVFDTELKYETGTSPSPFLSLSLSEIQYKSLRPSLSPLSLSLCQINYSFSQQMAPLSILPPAFNLCVRGDWLGREWAAYWMQGKQIAVLSVLPCYQTRVEMKHLASTLPSVGKTQNTAFIWTAASSIALINTEWAHKHIRIHIHKHTNQCGYTCTYS